MKKRIMIVVLLFLLVVNIVSAQEESQDCGFWCKVGKFLTGDPEKREGRSWFDRSALVGQASGINEFNLGQLEDSLSTLKGKTADLYIYAGKTYILHYGTGKVYESTSGNRFRESTRVIQDFESLKTQPLPLGFVANYDSSKGSWIARRALKEGESKIISDSGIALVPVLVPIVTPSESRTITSREPQKSDKETETPQPIDYADRSPGTLEQLQDTELREGRHNEPIQIYKQGDKTLTIRQNKVFELKEDGSLVPVKNIRVTEIEDLPKIATIDVATGQVTATPGRNPGEVPTFLSPPVQSSKPTTLNDIPKQERELVKIDGENYIIDKRSNLVYSVDGKTLTSTSNTVSEIRQVQQRVEQAQRQTTAFNQQRGIEEQIEGFEETIKELQKKKNLLEDKDELTAAEKVELESIEARIKNLQGKIGEKIGELQAKEAQSGIPSEAFINSELRRTRDFALAEQRFKDRQAGLQQQLKDISTEPPALITALNDFTAQSNLVTQLQKRRTDLNDKEVDAKQEERLKKELQQIEEELKLANKNQGNAEKRLKELSGESSIVKALEKAKTAEELNDEANKAKKAEDRAFWQKNWVDPFAPDPPNRNDEKYYDNDGNFDKDKYEGDLIKYDERQETLRDIREVGSATIGGLQALAGRFGEYRAISHALLPDEWNRDWQDNVNTEFLNDWADFPSFIATAVGAGLPGIETCALDDLKSSETPGSTTVLFRDRSGRLQSVVKIIGERNPQDNGNIPIQCVGNPLQDEEERFVCNEPDLECKDGVFCYEEDKDEPATGFFYKIDWGVASPADHEFTPYIDENNISVKFNVALEDDNGNLFYLYEDRDPETGRKRSTPPKQVIKLTNGASDSDIRVLFLQKKFTRACIVFDPRGVMIDRDEDMVGCGGEESCANPMSCNDLTATERGHVEFAKSERMQQARTTQSPNVFAVGS